MGPARLSQIYLAPLLEIDVLGNRYAELRGGRVVDVAGEPRRQIRQASRIRRELRVAGRIVVEPMELVLLENRDDCPALTAAV